MKQLNDYLAPWDLTLDAVQLDRFDRYQALLLEWNQRLNLTAITDPDEILRRHFLDSLSCAIPLRRHSDPTAGLALIDVGTGAGFPGLPLKILYPNLRLTLVESITKKTRFLAAVVAALNLTDVQILDERAETLGQNPAHRQQYDWVVARAVAEMRVLAEYLLPLCRLGGHALAQKGESAAEETTAAAHAITILGGGPPTIYPIHLPDHPQTHYLVVIPKEQSTPPVYPRPPGRPTKRPLS